VFEILSQSGLSEEAKAGGVVSSLPTAFQLLINRDKKDDVIKIEIPSEKAKATHLR
jgi:hypothetical protein